MVLSIQIKVTVWGHPIPHRMAVIKVTRFDKRWWEWSSEQYLHATGEAVILQSHHKVSQKTKKRISTGSINSTSVYASRRNEIDMSMGKLLLRVYCRTIHSSKTWDQYICLGDKWLKYFLPWNIVQPQKKNEVVICGPGDAVVEYYVKHRKKIPHKSLLTHGIWRHWFYSRSE